MNKIYFAHPVNIYDQPIENAFARLIAHYLTNDELSLIENPNQPKHQNGYDSYSKRLKENGLDHKGMNYFYDEVLPNCNSCAGVPFLDGRVGLGVAGEMKWFIEHDMLIRIVVPRWLLTQQDLNRFTNDPIGGCFFVRLATKSERDKIILFDQDLVVPHEETRFRTWRVYNREKRPYEEAHLVKMPIPEGFYSNV